MQISDEQILQRICNLCDGQGKCRERIGLDSTMDDLTEFAQMGFWIFSAGPDPDDLLEVILEHFGITPTATRWFDVFGQGFASESEMFNSAGDLTVGKLVGFIQRHLPEVAFEPVNICGRNCGPAGAFFGITEVASHLIAKDMRFAPSTPIADVLTGRMLSDFWLRLQRYTDDRLPHLVCCLKRRIDYIFHGVMVFAIVSCFAGFVWALISGNRDESNAWFFTWMILCGIEMAVLIVQLENPATPPGIRTFRDLAEHVSRALHEPPLTESRVTSSFPA